TNPDDAQQFGREAREPPILWRRAGFARGRQRKASRANTCPGAVAQYSLHQVHHQIVHSRIENTPFIRLRLVHLGPTMIANLLDEARLFEYAFVRERRVSSSHLK